MNDVVTVKTSVVVPQEAVNKTPCSPVVLGLSIAKGLYFLLEKHLLIHVHCCSSEISQEIGSARCHPADKRIIEMWCTYTVESYSAVKKYNFQVSG